MHEQRWRDLTEALPQLVWSAMPDGSCDYFSAQWTEHTGVPEADLLGWRWLETLHPDDREPTRKFWLESVAEHHPYDIEYRVRRRDGEYRWFKTRGVPVRDSDGAIIKWFGTGTDITELRETQEALHQANARIDLAVRGSSLSVWECDMPGGQIENGHPILVNMWESLGHDARTAPTDFPSAFALLVHPDDQERVSREIHQLFASDGRDYESEYRVRTRDGSTRWHLARGTVLRDPEGKPVRFIGTSADITERKRAEEALRERERQLDSLMGHLPGLAYRALADDHWTALFVSRGIEDLTGYPPQEFTSRRLNYADIMLPEDRPATRDAVFTALRERRMYEVEHRIRHKGGSVRCIWARGHGVFAPDGSLRFIEGLNLDVTRQKQAEESLRESEERFRGTFENAAVGIAHLGITGQVLRVNETCCAIVGYSREELLGKNFLDFSHPDDLATSNELFAGLLRGDSTGYTTEKRYLRKDGSPVWANVVVSLQRDAAGEPAYAIGVIQDISERKRLEEEVRLATARLELALRGSNIGFWDMDMPDGDMRNGRASYVNLWEQLGYEGADSPKDQESGLALVHPDDRVAHAEAARRYLAGETSEFEVEGRFCNKDGSFRWMISRGVAVRDAAGKPIRFLGNVIDITDRKRAEEALRESEVRFRQLAENVRGVFWLQEGGWERLLYISPLYEDFWGRSCQSLYEQPRSWIDSIHPEDRDLVFDHLAQQNRGIATETNFRIIRPDGSIRWMCCRAFPLKNAAGEVFRVGGLVEDITQRRQFEEELRRAKEAAESANRAKDEFLANVSHEIRTPMNAILGMAELTLDTRLTDEQRSNLNIVLTSAEGLLSLINDLLDFSKIEAGRLELEDADFSLRTVLNQTLRALALRAHKKGLELACQVEADVPDGLVGDGNRLRQVLLNLIGNAIKFTESGEVIVRVRLGPTDEQAAIDFEIADTGIGIPPEKQQTIFLAFEQADTSTTRRYGGTGLGLTISSRLVEMMGGQITLESQVGRGSTFRFGVRFGRSMRLAAAPAQPPVVDLHGLRVLIVDDNATNRMILQGWVSGWGMIPTETADGPAAMSALWRGIASKEPFALVLLDARMPGTNGLELAKGISQTPELSACRIILLTSEDRPGDAMRYRTLGISAVLMKPAQQEELLDNVYRVLSRGVVATDIAESVRATAPDIVHEAAARAVAAEASSRHLKVLVAEDNRFNQQVIQRMLERRGHTVRVVPTGRETLAALEQSAFDLLLLDVNMPEMDGFEVVRTLREREKTSENRLRVIALTALSGKRDRERCIEAGMDDFLVKPVRAAEVYAVLERLTPAEPKAPETHSAIIDAATLLSACAGDAALLADMIQLFQEEAPGLLARAEAAVQLADAEQIRKAAHALRGVVSAFSTRVAKAAEALEQTGIDGRIGEADEQYDSLKQAVEDLSMALPTLTLEKLHDLA